MSKRVLRFGRRGSCLGTLADSAGRSRRWARGSLALAEVGAVALLIAVFATPEPRQAAAAIPPVCQPGFPQPGPARPWEADVAISTYSRMNTHHGNVSTGIPIVSWSGLGPDMNMMLYYNSASVNLGNSIADVVGFDLGPGWSFSYSDHIRLSTFPNPTEVLVVRADGTRDTFYWSNSFGKWIPPSGVFDELSSDPFGVNQGAATQAFLMTVYRTLKLRGRNPTQTIAAALQTYLANGKPPPRPNPLIANG